MTDASPSCAACGWSLGAEDRFCSRCGMPTPLTADPEATMVNPVGARDSTADTGDWGVAQEEPSESAPPTTASAYNTRLRRVLGAEYQLFAMIGQGGFARVYKARDRRLDRLVAIKVIQPELTGKREFVESFRNEGVALAKLRHPGIIPIYDIREREGLIYYVMPFVQGTTLEARMTRSRLPPFETRRILSELADALGAAHRAKMIHLDIKPANVFLEGDLQKVLLMDFGIARALTEQVEGSGGPVVGTPEYMSPEQARALPEIDHRSDIYSLGVLGYRLLVGRPPFKGQDAAETLAKHINEAPVPLREINPTIPKDFADAIMRCLKKDPWQRFSTAMELRSVLDAVTFFSAQGEPVESPSLGVRGPALVLLVCVAILIGVLAGLGLR